MKVVFIACLCLLFVGCKSNKTNIGNAQKFDFKMDEDIFVKDYYIGYGNEPFWQVDVNEDSGKFILLNENIDTVFFKLIGYDDSGMHKKITFILLDSENDTGKLLLTECGIKNLCSDGMSEKLSKFIAEFNYKNKRYKGCRR